MKKSILSLCALSILVSSCASYNAQPLTPLSYTEVDVRNHAKTQDVTVVAKKLSKEDSLKYFDRNLLAKGIVPIQIFINNKSDKDLIFLKEKISLPLASVRAVAEKAHTSTVGRVTGYGLGSLVLWPLIIPAVVDGLKSSKANDQLDSDFYTKAAEDTIIRKNSTLDKVVFVPKDKYKSIFSLTLFDSESDATYPFDIKAIEG